MSSRQERTEEQQHSKRVRKLIIAIIIGLVIIIGGGVFAFYQLNKQDKIDTQITSVSPVKKHKRDSTDASSDSESEMTSSISSSSGDSGVSDSSVESSSEQSSADDEYYVNAYGHTIKKGEQDNTGIAIRDRERNVDLKNLDYIITAPLTYKQKMIQMKAWGFSFTPSPPSKDLYIWGRDTSSSTGAIGVIHTDGTVTKIN